MIPRGHRNARINLHHRKEKVSLFLRNSSKSDFLVRLRQGVIIGDGAMGTEIYRRANVLPHQCYEDVNRENPDLIRGIHDSFVVAGAELVEANTFGANGEKLSQHGLKNRIREINERGVQLAREAAKGKAYVAASVGPSGLLVADVNSERIRGCFQEQIEILAGQDPDVMILESFDQLPELELALAACRQTTNLPVIAQVKFRLSGPGQFVGVAPGAAFARLSALGADVIGTNCGYGPEEVFQFVSEMKPSADTLLSAFPNSGFPQAVGGRMHFLGSPRGMAHWGKQLFEAGVSLIGGCCGTTPEMIQAMAEYIRGVDVRGRGQVFIAASARLIDDHQKKPEIPIALKSPWGAILGTKFAASVEINPPKGTDPSKEVEAAKKLRDAGVDLVNIPDGPRAISRMCPEALAGLIQREVGMQTLIHVCARDRNYFRIQADLLGLNALGLRNVMLITGDPPKVDDQNARRPTPVFDLDSIGMITLAKRLNQGIDYEGKPLEGQTRLVIGTGCEPGAKNPEHEATRLQKKLEAGANFVFSQPVYEPSVLVRFIDLIRPFLGDAPFFVGIAPLANLANAEFLHQNVPGMQIPESVFTRLRGHKTKDAQGEEAIAIARESLAAARTFPEVKGVYIMPPFNNASRAIRVLAD